MHSQREIFVCLLFPLCVYLGFLIGLRSGCPKKSETTRDQHDDEDPPSEREDDCEESASEYQVFLSFRGPDSRQGLADVLYNDMKAAGIHVFRDNDELEIGDKISKILPAIENSKICVPIFSETFAASIWCLREVEAMVEHNKVIMPIFYTASPDDVKLRTELFKKDLRKHNKRHGQEQVKKWEDALKAVGKIIGREVQTTGFAGFSKLFVRALLVKLKVKMKYVTNFLVKRDDEEDAVIKLLDIDSNDVRLVGIHGVAGVGKTTLIKVIFDSLSTRFDCCSFLENVQESLRRNGLEHLQKQLLEDLDPKFKDFQRMDSLTKLRNNFRKRKVLIVLDDVNRREQIQMITGMLDWFGCGSRIIITTRDNRVLTKEKWTFEVREMNLDQALQLFSRHAFGKDAPPSDYHILSERIVYLTGCLPLALEVIGSLLYGCEKKRWEATIEKLKKVPNQDVQEKLKLSFDALDYPQKQIFLDIACFFIDKETSNAIFMWEASELFPYEGIEVLVSMSLLRITWKDQFRMHDLIRDLGRALVREECYGDPAERSRIWSHEDALEVLQIKKGKKKVEGLLLEEPYDGTLTNEEFLSFRRLRLLRLVGTKLAGDFEHLLPRLRWLSWHLCPSDFSATKLSLRKLVVLDLSKSDVSDSWAGWSLIKMAKDLKVLDLTECCKLESTPDLSNNKVLERLILSGCRNLVQMHASVGKLQRLKHLVLEGTNLKSTPDLSNNEALERLILSGCDNLAELHASVGKLKRLRRLDLEGCPSLRGLPDELGELKNLEEIFVSGNGGAFHVPESIAKLCSLSVVRLRRVEITRVPRSIGGLLNLTSLDLSMCTGLMVLPDTIGDMRSLLELNLSYTKTEELPNRVGDLKALRRLDVSHTQLSALPDSLGRLDKLQSLHLESTMIEELPDSLGSLGALEGLYLTSSPMRILPNWLGDLSRLLELRLDGSKISKLPSTIGKLTSLQSLLAHDCNLTEIPTEIGNISSLSVLCLSVSSGARFPLTVNHLTSLKVLSMEFSLDESGSGDESPIPALDLGALTQLQTLELDCLGWKCIARLPPALLELTLRHVTPETKLPDLSNLKDLWKIVFEYCSLKDVHELESLRELPTLESMEVTYSTKELVVFSCELQNLRSLTISGTSEKVLDISLSRNLQKLRLTSCKELVELRGLEKLEFLKDLNILDCNSLKIYVDDSDSDDDGDGDGDGDSDSDEEDVPLQSNWITFSE